MTAIALDARGSTAPLRRAAIALSWLGALLVAAGAALTIANIGTPLPEGTNWRLADAGGVALMGFGALLAIRLPGNAVSWVALTAGLSQVASLAANEYAVFGQLTRDGEVPAGELAQWFGTWMWAPGYCLIPTLLLLLFPDGRPPSPRWRLLVPVTLVVIGIVTLWFAVAPYEELGEPTLDAGADRPLESQALADLLAPLLFLLVPCVLACAASVVARLRRATGEERQQLRWFGAGVTVALLVLLAGQALDDYAPGALAVALTVLPACIFVAIVRHGLWELGPLARRSVVYGLLSVVGLAVYGLAVLVLGGGQAIATVLVAVVLAPLHARVSRAVNRLLYGDRDEPWAAARRLGERLTAPGDPLREIGDALRLPRVELREPAAAPPAAVAAGRPAAADGTAAAPLATRVASREIAVPLVFAGEHVGTLVAGGRELGAADRRALEQLAPPLAAAVHAARLADDLRESRERIVAAREEERRRLRNDLHDEVGPSLAVLALRLDAEGRDELAAQARADLARIRALVRDLRPAALDDLGLAAALAQEVDALRTGGLDARLDAPEDLGELPAAVEVAAYRIAREALANVVRHSRAKRCSVRLARDGDALVLAVADDGQGMPAVVRPGVGLESMRARAEEIGGSFELGPARGGGTRVSVRLPL
jgi:signal transduction histidine kinase